MAIKKIIEYKKIQAAYLGMNNKGEEIIKKSSNILADIEATDEQLFELGAAIGDVLNYEFAHVHETAKFDLVEQQA